MSDPTKEDLMARIAELEKQAAAKKAGKLEFKVSEKGGVAVYGLGRFPTTLYPTFPFWTLCLNLRIVAIINIHAGVNAMKTLRRSVPNG